VKTFATVAWCAVLLRSVAFPDCEAASALQAAAPTAPAFADTNRLAFVNTSFENASPVWYEFKPDGVVLIHLLYDHERGSPNRAAGHIHLMLEGTPGSRLTLELTNLSNVWNGQPGSIARELKSVVVSTDGRRWTSVPTRTLAGDRIQVDIEMPGPQLYLARVEPYRISDLDRWLSALRGNSSVSVESIGKTVQGRDLEIVRLGNPRAPHRVFLRARAHPWEAGGNWVVEGLTERLLKGDAEASRDLERYCVYIQPMANKDGVARGGTRFNVLGKDLNRDWDKPANPQLAPENAALERWLETMIARGEKPDLALEMHNDGNGLLHISRPTVRELSDYLERMRGLEGLLRRYTWFTEGSTPPSFQNTGTLGDGWLQRYRIDAAVHEFNCNWIAGLKDYPSAQHWKEYGAALATVFYEYFNGTDRSSSLGGASK
jgi:hypothetical protein